MLLWDGCARKGSSRAEQQGLAGGRRRLPVCGEGDRDGSRTFKEKTEKSTSPKSRRAEHLQKKQNRRPSQLRNNMTTSYKMQAPHMDSNPPAAGDMSVSLFGGEVS